MNSFTDIFQQYFTPLSPPPNPPYVSIQVPPCSQHLWEALGYLPIVEMGNFAVRGIFMWWLESEEEE